MARLPHPLRSVFRRNGLAFPALLLMLLMPACHTSETQVQSPSSELPRIASGPTHALAVKPDGTVWAWGSNLSGQLGDGTTLDRSTPGPVGGLSNVVAVSAGGGDAGCFCGVGYESGSSLALKRDGTLWSWGLNQSGQLGDGSITDRHSPVAVSGLQGVVAASMGLLHGLAVKGDGTVWAWGYNGYGALGDGTTADHLVPAKVLGLTGVVDVKAGDESSVNYSVALKGDGTVWIWGDNSFSEFGDGSTTASLVPKQVPGLSNVVAIAAQFGEVEALTKDGTVWAWGLQSRKAVPTLVTGIGNVAAIRFNTALRADGTVWIWQYDWSTPDVSQTAPTQVTGLPNIAQIGSSWGSLFLTGDNHVWAWGDNTSGILGNGQPLSQPSPQTVGLSTVSHVSALRDATAALKTDGSVWTWGESYWLASPNVGTTSSPTQIPGLSNVVSVADSGYHCLALSGGQVYAWGYNGSGALGDGTTTDSNVPVRVLGLSGVTAIAAGKFSSLALKADGTVWVWGYDSSGAVNQSTPVQISGLTGITAIAAAGGLASNGYDLPHSLALKADGTVWAWGTNRSGQLGDGTTTTRRTPVQVSGLTGITSIAAGPWHSLAVKNDGTVWAWGHNSFGELGDGTTTGQLVPVQVSGLNGATAVACGGGLDINSANSAHSLALKGDGTVWAWGANTFGQLGDATRQNRLTAVQVPGLAGVATIAAGATHSVAITATALKTWGADYYGQLGLGRVLVASTPIQVY